MRHRIVRRHVRACAWRCILEAVVERRSSIWKEWLAWDGLSRCVERATQQNLLVDGISGDQPSSWLLTHIPTPSIGWLVKWVRLLIRVVSNINKKRTTVAIVILCEKSNTMSLAILNIKNIAMVIAIYFCKNVLNVYWLQITTSEPNEWYQYKLLAEGSSVPLVSERKWSDPHWKQVHCLFLFGRWHDHLSAVVLYWSSVLCSATLTSTTWPWRRAVLSADAGLLVLHGLTAEFIHVTTSV